VSINVNALAGTMTPRLLYRVTRTAPRLASASWCVARSWTTWNLRALRSNVEAAGKDLRVANYFGDIPETVLAPALLMDDVTLRRANKKNDSCLLSAAGVKGFRLKWEQKGCPTLARS